MDHDLLEEIKRLSLNDTKSLSQQGLKLFEEGGELAKCLLPYDNADGTRHRFVDREKVLEEICDVMLVALSIAYKMKFSNEKIFSMLRYKTLYWEKLQSIPSHEEYPYEIHITVQSAESVDKFLEDCTAIGVKGIVLDLHTKQSGIIHDVMTSSTIIGNNGTVIEEMTRITVELEQRGYTVIRQKIETVPWHPHVATERTDDNYFEAHIPVVVDEGDREDLYDMLKMHPGSHLSRNALKKNHDDTKIYMITIRHNDCDLDTFKSRLKRLTDALDDDDFEFGAKEMIEWAIYDNNVKHDKAWTD